MTKTEYITLLSRITVSVMQLNPSSSRDQCLDIAEDLIASAVGRAEKVFPDPEDAHLD